MEEQQPALLIGSPMCTLFSKMQALNSKHWDPLEFQKALKAAKEHLKFCLELYRLQIAGGRYFLHEHPSSASSWNLPEMISFIAQFDVDTVVGDMCAHGMVLEGRPVRKSTRWLSNCPALLQALGKQCTNNGTFVLSTELVIQIQRLQT